MGLFELCSKLSEIDYITIKTADEHYCLSAVIFLGELYMIRELKNSDFEIVKSMLTCLHELHLNNRPDFYQTTQNIISKKEYIKMLNDNNKVCIGYEKNNRIVGICLSTIKTINDVKTIYIEDIFVKPNCRNLGIAANLFNQIEKIAIKEKIERIDLMVWAFNNEALKFYASIGMNTQRIFLEKWIQNE